MVNEAVKKILSGADLQKVTVPKGAVICREGQTCDGLVIVESGLVSVMKRSEDGRAISLYDITEGESCILTLSCLLNREPFPAEAIAQSETCGIVIPTALVNEWFMTKPEWAKYVLSVISTKLADVITLADSLAFSNLNSRLSNWLQEHSHNGVVNKTHQEIAESLGSSREVISRVLKSFEREGLVALSRARVELTKPYKS